MTDFEEVREKLGVENEEQIEIADYELPFDLHSDMPLWEVNANCRMVLELEGTPIGNEMKAIQQKWFSSFDEFIDHKDEIRYGRDLDLEGRFVVTNHGVFECP